MLRQAWIGVLPLRTLLSGRYQTRAGGSSGAPSLLVSASPSARGLGSGAGCGRPAAGGAACQLSLSAAALWQGQVQAQRRTHGRPLFQR